MIEVKGVAEAQKALERIAASIPEINEKTLDEIGMATLQRVKERTPVRTGRLARGHKMRKLSRNAIELFNDVEYAGAVEYGSSTAEPRPHWRPALEVAKKEFPRMYAKNAQTLDRTE